MTEIIRVLLVDDHPVVRQGIRNLLDREKDLKVVGEVSDGSSVFDAIERCSPDVLILDMELPGLSGVEIARRLQAEDSPIVVLGLSAYDDEHYLREVLAAGASGYLTKEEALEKIVEAVRGVARGEKGWFSRRAAAQMASWVHSGRAPGSELTEREREVLALLAEGWTNERIGRELSISERTVRFHLSNAYQKLGFRNRAEAVAWAVQTRLSRN